MPDIHPIRKQLRDLPRTQLIDALEDIAQRLLCDEHGNIDPTESTAAHSAADFVDACNHTMQSLGIIDSEPAEYLNKYECPCGTAWENVDDCTCNDRCPECRTECQPVHSSDY